MTEIGMPIPTTSEHPFWLARADVEGETRLIFQTAKPCDVSRYNAFSARDVLLAAGELELTEDVNEGDLLVRAIALGVEHEEAIAGLIKVLERRSTDPAIKRMESELAIFGYGYDPMHQWSKA